LDRKGRGPNQWLILIRNLTAWHRLNGRYRLSWRYHRVHRLIWGVTACHGLCWSLLARLCGSDRRGNCRFSLRTGCCLEASIAGAWNGFLQLLATGSGLSRSCGICIWIWNAFGIRYWGSLAICRSLNSRCATTPCRFSWRHAWLPVCGVSGHDLCCGSAQRLQYRGGRNYVLWWATLWCFFGTWKQWTRSRIYLCLQRGCVGWDFWITAYFSLCGRDTTLRIMKCVGCGGTLWRHDIWRSSVCHSFRCGFLRLVRKCMASVHSFSWRSTRKLMRTVWQRKIVPKVWRRAGGVLIPKEKKAENISQFRPISFLNVEGKIWTTPNFGLKCN